MRLVVMPWIVSVFFCAVATAGGLSDNSFKSTEPLEKKISKEISTANKKDDSAGKKVYERFCVVCHRDGLVGAPKFRDQSQWDKRLSGHELDELVASALKGKNAMPAKGTCYECTEDDLKSAVEYMLPHHD